MTSERQVDHSALCYVFLLERHLPTSMFTHLLDIPLLGVMIYCGAVRPSGWLDSEVALVVAVLVSTALATIVPRLASARSCASTISRVQ